MSPKKKKAEEEKVCPNPKCDAGKVTVGWFAYKGGKTQPQLDDCPDENCPFQDS